MDNYVDLLKNQIDNLYGRIYKEKDIIIAYNLIENGKSGYKNIFMLPEIINKNLQVGNYRRASRDFFLAEKLMEEVEQNHCRIQQEITDYMIRD